MPLAFIHETSIIDDGATIGEGTKVWQWCHVSGSAVIGENCVLGQNVYIGPNVVIGDGCKIQNNVSVFEGVTLEEDVFCGPSCVFTNVINPRANVSRPEFTATLVGKGATIGANAVIVCGVVIGAYAFIGAGAVVTKDVPRYALVYGNPARQAGWVCSCGVKLETPKSGVGKWREWKGVAYACPGFGCGIKFKWQEGRIEPI